MPLHEKILVSHLECGMVVEVQRPQTNSRIPTRWLDQSISRFYPATLLGLFYHTQCNAVFDTAACIHILELRIHRGFDSQRLWYLVQSNHGCIANDLCYRVPDAMADWAAWWGCHD
jgi:hypothetical protein